MPIRSLPNDSARRLNSGGRTAATPVATSSTGLAVAGWTPAALDAVRTSPVVAGDATWEG